LLERRPFVFTAILAAPWGSHVCAGQELELEVFLEIRRT